MVDFKVEFSENKQAFAAQLVENEAGFDAGFDRLNPLQGPPGKDGYTPVKGTDYYTEADKAEMAAAVVAVLPF